MTNVVCNCNTRNGAFLLFEWGRLELNTVRMDTVSLFIVTRKIH